MDSTLIKEIEEKAIVWFKNSNQYVVVEKIVAKIIQKIILKETTHKIAKYIEREIEIPFEEAFLFINDIEKKIVVPNTTSTNSKIKNTSYQIPSIFAFEKLYAINSIIIKVEFSNEFELSLIHPKFAHLEVKESSEINFCFQVFNAKKETFLILDDTFIGAWGKEDIHYFQGKFSMKIIESIYKKSEEEWMGVFHASAINYREDSILILGDSGNGKSTSLALLQTQGFNCIADDFVPIDNKNKVYAFPAGISIKPKALDVLISTYPELKNSAEYHYKRLNKTVRYLPPNSINYSKKLPCKALVFIKYDRNIEFKLTEISNLKAFDSLLPDSWISSVSENADVFLTWFSSLPCYQLTYSNNEMMYDSIKRIFEDEV